jgi:excisionase family DNA binding protein
VNDFTTIENKLRGRQAIPVEEAASLLGIGRRTAYDAIARGDIPNAGLPGKGKAKRVPAWFLIRQLSPYAAT